MAGQLKTPSQDEWRGLTILSNVPLLFDSRCPSCSFPALLDSDVKRFSCPNPRCRKVGSFFLHLYWNRSVGFLHGPSSRWLSAC